MDSICETASVLVESGNNPVDDDVDKEKRTKSTRKLKSIPLLSNSSITPPCLT